MHATPGAIPVDGYPRTKYGLPVPLNPGLGDQPPESMAAVNDS